jgi:signal transduction histidine kinase
MTPVRGWRRWFPDTLFMRLFLLMWAALVLSHLAAYQLVTSGLLLPWPAGRPGSLPTFPSLPPTPGLPGGGGPPHPRPGGEPGTEGPGFMAPDPGPPPGRPAAGPVRGAGRPQGLPVPVLALDYGVRLLLIGAAAWLGARWLSAPMRRLVDASRALGASLGRGPALPRLDEGRGTVEVREAARVFNQMASELHEQFQSRGLLMASLSHDLRTPLTRMRIRLEPLAAEPVAGRCIADIRDMDQLIETALEVFRHAHAPEPVQPTDLHALVQALADDLAEQGHAVTVTREDPQADASVVRPPRGLSQLGSGPSLTHSLVLPLQPVATRRIVSNLLGNALRYGTRADVAVRVEEDGWACVVIDDDGPGIPEAQLGEVLRPFYRVDSSRSRDTGGTGLGLYIVRDLTQRQGGELALSNRPQGGLRARVRFRM